MYLNELAKLSQPVFRRLSDCTSKRVSSGVVADDTRDLTQSETRNVESYHVVFHASPLSSFRRYCLRMRAHCWSGCDSIAILQSPAKRRGQ